MKRRTFIAGSTSLLAVSSVSGKWSGVLAGSFNRILPGHLVLKLSEDARQVIVIETPSINEQATPRQMDEGPVGRALRIMASQFGDKTTFRLGRSFGPEDTRHTVYIDNAAMGSKRGIANQIIFNRENTDAHWTISLSTTAFGGTLDLGPIRYRNFLFGDPLQKKIRAIEMSKVLPELSGGRMSIRGNGKWSVSVDSEFTWRLSGLESMASFVAFGGRLVSTQPIEMRWWWMGRAALPLHSTGEFETTQDLVNPIHLIKATEPAFGGFELLDTQKRWLRISAVKGGKPAELCIFHRPDAEPVQTSPSLAVLSLAHGTIEAGNTLGIDGFSTLPAGDFYILERLEKAGELRTVISGSVAQDDAIECRTAAGTVMLASLQPIGVANDSGRRLDVEQRQAQIAKSGIEGVQERQDRQAGEDPLEEKLKSYLALLAPNRPYGDQATIYISANSGDGPNQLPVTFQTIVISAALHAMDQALPGSDWSRLRFGVVPDQMRRSKVTAKKEDHQVSSQTAGTALHLIYPMPDTLRTDYAVVIAMFPTKDSVLARISMDRARLDVASAKGLVDLSFGFRGLSLLLDGGPPRLLPDNSGCQVQRMMDGSLVDTRPVLIIDLPPQHVLEEAWFRPVRIAEADKAAKRLDESLKQADVVIDNLRKRQGGISNDGDVSRADRARLHEGQVESADAFYALWREFFRDSLLDRSVDFEFFAFTNRQHLDPADLSTYDCLVDQLKTQFIALLAKVALPPNVMRARLSGRSRLAFRMRCDTVSEDLGILGTVPFTVSDLTMLGRLELAVTRRAELLARPLPDGRVPAADEASYDNIDGTTVLDFQGIVGGQRTVFTHMDSVRSALARLPKPDETSLELVSRLIFSPSQRAIFLTDAPVPEQVFVDSLAEKFAYKCSYLSEPSRLWSLRLLIDGRYGPHSSDIRVVATPDYRAEALRPWPAGKRDEVYGAPPYGNKAPWLLPRAPSAALSPEDFTVPTAPPAVAGPGLFQKCQQILSGDVSEQRKEAQFRTGLSANDRHQLLLLSGAYGLPVIGKRKQNQDGKAGELVADSDQFSTEPGYTLAELDPGQAIYAPRSLDVSHLALSALGATFRHDTHFNPPLPALLLKACGAPQIFDKRPAFDGLSICRWEHNSLLGRDLRVRVAYKGYLMPTGHQATFVKLTERRIVHTTDGKLRAVQVQRMFITLSTPELTFPRLEQPYAGRGWPCAKVIVQDPSAIEIADPYGASIPQATVGLAFWPVRAADLNPLKFSLSVGGASTAAQMMFVDNVAIGDPGVLAKLALVYNSTVNERIWSFGGAKLPYAQAKKRGDTDLCTQRLCVRVTGRNLSPLPADSWVGPCDEFQSSSVLEGAGEPPFFPALEWADISLDGPGKLVGAEAKTVTAYYDGCYVREGFAVSDDKALQPNPLGVYLHFNGEGPVLDVGNNGDRTAGFARPNAVLRGLSRELGPLGHESPTFKDGPSDELCRRFTAPKCSPLAADGYRSITHLYDTKQDADGDAVVLDAPTSGGPKTIAKSFFASDAKLLGTITFADLFELVDDSGALSDILPALEQALDFGLAVADTVEATRKMLKERVLLPLSDLLQAFEAQWVELERQLHSRTREFSTDDASQQLTLASLFPVLDETRLMLRMSLNEAIAEEDVLQMPGKLSALQEAAGRFLQVLGEFARRPVETFAASLRTLLDRAVGNLRAALTQLEVPTGLVKLLQSLEKDPAGFEAGLRKLIVETVAEKLQEEFSSVIPERFRLIPWPDLPEIFEAEKIAYQEILKSTFGSIQLKNSEVGDVLKSLLERTDKSPVALATILIQPLLEEAKKARLTIEKRDELVTQDDALVAMNHYIYQLETFFVDLKSTEVSAQTEAILGRINAECYRLLHFREQLSRLKDFMHQGNLAGILVCLAELAQGVGGPQFAGAVERLGLFLITTAKGVALSFKDFASASDDERQACKESESKEWDSQPIIDLSTVEEPLKQIRDLMEQAKKLKVDVEKFDSDSKKNLVELENIDDGKLSERIKEGITHSQELLQCVLVDGAKAFCGVVRFKDAAQTLERAVADQPDPAAVLTRVLQVQALLLVSVLEAVLDVVTELGNYVKDEGAILVVGGALQELNRRVPSLTGDVEEAAKDILAAVTTLKQQTAGFAKSLLETLNAIFKQLEKLVRAPLAGLDAALARIIDPKLGLPAGFIDAETLRLVTQARQLLTLPADMFATFEEPQGGTAQLNLDTVLNAQRPDKTTLRDFIIAPQTPKILEPDNLLRAQAVLQQLYQHVQNRIKGLPDAFLSVLARYAKDFFGHGPNGLRQIYATLYKTRQDLIEWLDKNASWIDTRELDAALSPPEGEGDAFDALVIEKKLVDELPLEDPLSDPVKREKIMAFASIWSAGQAAPVLILKGLQSITERVLRGDILSFIDISGLRDEIEDRISALVPTRQTLRYDFGVSLTAGGPTALFSPQPGCRFEVGVFSEVNLLDPEQFTFETQGSIGAFNINLVHQFGIEAIRLIFGGATFRMARGEKVSFDADFQDFEIGPALEFVQQLQESLSIGASGVYLEPLLGTPGIRVGYGLDIGIITLGALSFSNVTVGIAADLPFSDDQALFSVSLGRRMAPFMISALPWAGSGYLAILSTAQEIVGFEMGLEFGVGGAFMFGPLVGQGRVQAGFAIRTVELKNGKRVTEISGTFFAGGSANIWIFTFSACLYVRLTMDTGSGSMQGEAVFAFSFKVGFAQFSYQVRAHYSQNKLSNDGGKAAGGAKKTADHVRQTYPRDPYLELASIDSSTYASVGRQPPDEQDLPPPRSEEAIRDTRSMKDGWKTYSEYFDSSLLKGAL